MTKPSDRTIRTNSLSRAQSHEGHLEDKRATYEDGKSGELDNEVLNETASSDHGLHRRRSSGGNGLHSPFLEVPFKNNRNLQRRASVQSDLDDVEFDVFTLEQCRNESSQKLHFLGGAENIVSEVDSDGGSESEFVDDPSVAKEVEEAQLSHKESNVMAIAWSASLIIFGACSAVISLEAILKRDPSSGNLLTFAQFLFVAVQSLPNQLKRTSKGSSFLGVQLKTRTIPLSWHSMFVALCFTMSGLSNASHNFGISIPLHVVFKSSSLVASMAVGAVVLQKKYTIFQVASVMTVLGGVLLVTLSSLSEEQAGPDHKTVPTSVFLAGVAMLAISLFLSAFLGVMQELSYRTFGRDWQESMFYSHAMAIPFFGIFAGDIKEHIELWNQSEPFTIPGILSLPLPEMWVFLLCNIIMVYVGIRGIYRLTSLSSSLSCTLVITVRKFLSLLISVFYFGNSFEIHHWIGSILVFLGTASYVYTSKSGAHGKDE